MNNILRDHALRLALYLYRLGIDPHVSGARCREYLSQLTPLYCSIPTQLRQKARTEGRKLIRETGGVELAASHLLPKPSLALEITCPWKKGYQWSKAQGGTNDKCRVVSIHCPQDSGDVFRIGCCSKVTLYDRFKCAAEIAGNVPLAASSRNTVAKTWPQLPNVRCAVSGAPRFSIRRTTSNNSFGVISASGRPPIRGKTSFTKRA
jgi:hypothetical protein